MDRRPTLSLSEWAVLGVLVERARHGYDVAAALQPDQPLGAVWRLERQPVYRALERLVDLGYAEPRRTEVGGQGPPRTVHGPTRSGRNALKRWLATPVDHLRDVRSGLLLKLVLLDRLALDRAPLLVAQRAAFAPVLDRLAEPPPPDDPIAGWRHHSAAAVAAFLDSLGA